MRRSARRGEVERRCQLLDAAVELLEGTAHRPRRVHRGRLIQVRELRHRIAEKEGELRRHSERD